MSLKKLFKLPKIHLTKIAYTPSKVVLYAHVKTKGSSCPRCTAYSKRVHSHYIRQATDLPILEYKTCLLLKTRKFSCTNPKCPQKVFSEQTPGIERYCSRFQNSLKPPLKTSRCT